MTVRVVHPFHTTKADGSDPTQVQPSHWNAEHMVELQGPALLGRKDGNDAAAQEISVGAGLVLDADGLKVDRSIVAPPPVTVSGVSGLGQVAVAMLAAGWSVTGWQWQRVLVSGAVAPIAGATSAAYMQQAADVIPGTRIYPQPIGLTYSPPGLVAGGVVVPLPLSIAGTPVTTATLGVPYAGFTVAAAGGTVPYSYAVVNGPLGMVVSASGTVTYPTPVTGTYAGITIRATDGVGAVADLNFSLIVASGAVSPGPVTNVQAGTATTNSQPLTWSAATGTGPIVYQVAVRLGTSNGAYTDVGTPVSGTGATVTGLAPSTAYDYQVTPINQVGPGTPGFLNDAVTAAAAPSIPTNSLLLGSASMLLGADFLVLA